MAVPALFSETGNYAVFLKRGLVTLGGISFVIFVNLEWLLPQLFFKKNYWQYGFVAFALIISVSYGIHQVNQKWFEVSPFRMEERKREFRPNLSERAIRPNRPDRQKRKPGRFFNGFRTFAMSMPYLLALIGSSLFEIAVFANQKEREAVGLRNEKLETEMKFLKSQINPHFLFNTLNNIYTLTVIKSDDAPGHLLKLSGMLRYMLYECNTERVSLQKEADYIRNYIDLQMLKDSGGLNVEVDLADRYPDLKIAPLLFIPFIENAFKHSKIEDLDKGWIKISLKVKDRRVYLQVENSLLETDYTKDEAGGIGLKNVERQLELLYPERHRLDIKKEKDRFRIDLMIDSSLG